MTTNKKRRIGRKVFAILLTLCLVFSTTCTSVFATELTETPVAGDAVAQTESDSQPEAAEGTGSTPNTVPEATQPSSTPNANAGDNVSNGSILTNGNASNAKAIEKNYAALDEFLTAVEAVGETDDVESLLRAIDKCINIYNRLSPEDQKAQEEAYAYIVSYREEVAAGTPDEGIETLAGSNSYVMLHPTSGTTPTGVKVKVGDTINGYKVYQISGNDIYIDLGTYNVSMNSFQIPWPENVWEGVKTQYNPQTYVIAGTAGAVGKSPGASALLGNGGNTFYYYNLGYAASSGGDETVENPGGGGSNTENGSSGSYNWNAKIIYHANLLM